MLDWGQITPEASDLKSNEFFYVYNHDLTSDEKIDRTLRFIIGRLNYYDKHLPSTPKHILKIDIRGQQLGDSICEYISQQFQLIYSKPKLLEINFIKI